MDTQCTLTHFVSKSVKAWAIDRAVEQATTLLSAQTRGHGR